MTYARNGDGYDSGIFCQPDLGLTCSNDAISLADNL